MESHPSIVLGRRRQHELLRSWSGRPLALILIDPEVIPWAEVEAIARAVPDDCRWAVGRVRSHPPAIRR